MAARRVFVISSAGLTAHHREGSKLLDPFPFPPDEEGRAHFARYLERFPNDLTWIIADVVEEEFREETIPHVHGRDRRALLRAKASRAFRDARYVHSARLGREPDGRRDDRMLFSAITRSDVLDPWLASMARHAVPLAGIYSPATLTGGMLKAIGAEGEHVLVVSLQSGGGLRQTCFRRGRLRLSRLAVMPEPVPGRYGASVLAEVERTRRYLGSLDAADEGSLEVHVLSHGAPLDDLRRELRRDAAGDLRTACTPVDLAGVARRLGMRRWDGEAIADRLFVHCLARRPPSNHYATREETRGFATVRARSLLRAASAALVAGGCLFGSVTILEGVIAGGHARSLATQAMLYEGRYREAQATLPPAPAEPVELERVVSAVDTLHGRRADPVDLLALISRALAGFPRVRVEGLGWRTSGDAEAPVAMEVDERAAPRPAGEALPRDPEALFQIALVRARIEPFDGDYRAALETVRRLAGVLAASAGVEHVRVPVLPLDLSSKQTLTGDAETTAEIAAFEIRVALRAVAPDGAEDRPVLGRASRMSVPATVLPGRDLGTTAGAAEDRPVLGRVSRMSVPATVLPGRDLGTTAGAAEDRPVLGRASRMSVPATVLPGRDPGTTAGAAHDA